MIGIDTNVLIRYIVQDDPQQSKLATTYIENKCTKKTPGFINHIVLCEIVWVLKRAYGFEKDVIVRVLLEILSTKELMVDKSSEVRIALEIYLNGTADFSDYLLGINNQISGCKHTCTLDKKAAQSEYFILLT